MSDSEESVDLGDIRTQLSRKIEQVLGWYKLHFNIKNASKSTTDCRNLFDSMVRWHKNSHISEKTWMESSKTLQQVPFISQRTPIAIENPPAYDQLQKQ